MLNLLKHIKNLMRALTLKNLLEKKHSTLSLASPWAEVFGEPEDSGIWLIWGKSANGKTTLALMLANYFASFCRVLYISAEEGTGAHFQNTAKRIIGSSLPRMHFVPYIDFETIDEKLSKDRRHIWQVVFIDNVTVYYDEITKKRFKAFMQAHPHILFIWLAHEERRDVDTALGKYIYKLADILIHVEGLAADVSKRCPGGRLIIDEEKAAIYHGSIATDSQIKNS